MPPSSNAPAPPPSTPPPSTPQASVAPVASGRPPRVSTGTAALVALLLAIPCVALALVPVYSRTSPSIAGFPFFYWYQLAWVVLTPILTWAAFLLIKRGRR